VAGEHKILAWVAANTREAREDLGLTQQDLADRSKLSRRYVQKIESGTVNVTVETIARLAQALKVEPADLVQRARLRKRKVGRPRKSEK
jgi:transcriptional regulator with XRE-family HTH domain